MKCTIAPKRQSSKRVHPSARASPAAPCSKRCRILIVDDTDGQSGLLLGEARSSFYCRAQLFQYSDLCHIATCFAFQRAPFCVNQRPVPLAPAFRGLFAWGG